MPLFERLNNRLRLTESGALLITHVRQTLQQHERVRARIEDLKRKRRSEVTIATTSGLAAGLLPRVVAEFRAHHVSVKTSVRILPVGQIIASLGSGESDLGLATGLPDDIELETFAVATGRFGAVMAPSHDAAARSAIGLADCRDLPLILADIGMPLRLVLDQACEAAGITLEPIIESNSLEMLKRSAMLGQGVTFLYFAEVEEEVRRGDLAFVPLQDPHVAAQTLRIVYRLGGELGAAPTAFAEALKAAIAPPSPAARAAPKAATRAQNDATRRTAKPVDVGAAALADSSHVEHARPRRHVA